MLIDKCSDYKAVIEQAKKARWNWQFHMMVVPVHFSAEHKDLLNHTKLYWSMDIFLTLQALLKSLLL